jgi:hypothetical protein
MPVAIKSSGGGSVTIAAASTASDFTATLQSATGTIPVVTPGTSGNLLTSDGTNWTSAAAPAGSLNSETFYASGTFTAPTGVTKLKVTVIGGGGSGVRGYDACSYSSAQTAGGPGGVAVALVTVTPGTAYTVTVGVGGAGRTTLGNGNAGTTSSFGTLATATGGAGGIDNATVQTSGAGSTTGTLIRGSTSTSTLDNSSGVLAMLNSLVFAGTRSTTTTAPTLSNTSPYGAGLNTLGTTSATVFSGNSGAVLVEWVG